MFPFCLQQSNSFPQFRLSQHLHPLLSPECSPFSPGISLAQCQGLGTLSVADTSDRHPWHCRRPFCVGDHTGNTQNRVSPSFTFQHVNRAMHQRSAARNQSDQIKVKPIPAIANEKYLLTALPTEFVCTAMRKVVFLNHNVESPGKTFCT